MENLEKVDKQNPNSEDESKFKSIREYFLQKSISNNTSFEALINIGGSNLFPNIPTK
jgi:hypothetical protein